jgi:putative inorganic carbon (HCO3(-)) transporter
MNLDKLLQRTISYTYCLLVFLTPLFLTPYNFELFEFNKMMLVYGLTTVITTAWLGRMVLQKKIIWYPTPLDPFILLFLFSQLISTLFSIDQHTSIWGYYSRFHGGLLSSTAYCLLFWAYINNVSKQKINTKNDLPKIIFFILLSAVLVAVYGIMEKFGIDKNIWVQDVQNRVFSTLGQPNWLAAYLNAVIFIPLALVMKNKSPKNKIIYLVLYLLFYITLVFTKSKSGLAAYWLAMPTFYLISYLWQKKPLIKEFFINLFVFVTLTAVFYPQLVTKITTLLPLAKPSQTQNNIKVLPSGKVVRIHGSPTSQIRQVVWKGALTIWQNYPFFGSGNETFAYAYYNFRPNEHNQNSEWDFLYNKAHNEYLNYLATTGLVGLVAVLAWQLSWPLVLFSSKNKNTVTRILLALACTTLLLIVNPGHIFDFFINRVFIYPPIRYPLILGSMLAILLVLIYLFWQKKRKKSSLLQYYFAKKSGLAQLDWLHIGLLSGFFTIFLTNFYGFSVVVIGLFTALFPAISLSLLDLRPKHISAKPSKFSQLLLGQKAVLITLLAVLLLMLYRIILLWQADRLFVQGRNMHQSGQYLMALEPLIKAESLNPKEPFFKSQLGETSATLAYLYHAQDSTDSAKLAQDLADLSLLKGKEALLISPFHINYYKSMAKIYLSLAKINDVYHQQAIDILIAASKLSPTDPKLLVNIGLLQKNAGQNDQAIKNLLNAIKLKPDYDRPYIYLARLYIANDQPDQAAVIYQQLLENHYPPSLEAQDYLQKLENDKNSTIKE